MSGVKALEELRGLRDEAASKMVDNPKWVCRRAEEIADEIEAEIAERYMPRPCDGNGEPIHMGDVLVPKDYGTRKREVIGVNYKEFFFVDDEEGRIKKNRAHCWKHMEPRTLEDVLSEMLDRNSDGIGLREFNGDFAAFVEHYADEIRELMGAES